MNRRSNARHPPGPPHLRGVLGGGGERPGKANLRLIRRAIRGGWLDAAPQAVRDALMQHCLAVALTGHERNALAAAGCILAADSANLREGACANP